MDACHDTQTIDIGVAPPDRRQKNRISMMLMATVRYEGARDGVKARILDLSSGGIRVATICTLRRGHRLVVSLKGVGDVPGRIAWARGAELGVEFDHEVDPGGVVRALTGMPPASHINFAKAPVPRPGFRVR